MFSHLFAYFAKEEGAKSAGAKLNMKQSDKQFARDKNYNSRKEEPTGPEDGIVVGRNPVIELLRSGRDVDKLFVLGGNREGSVKMIVSMAVERGIPVVESDRAKLDMLSGGVNHQGVAASAPLKEYCTVDDILAIAKERGEDPFIVACDGIEDPHNLGAIIRCAEGAGAHGVIIPKRRTATVTAATAKTSAGALEHMAICRVSAIAPTLRELKDKGLWVYGAEAGGEDVFDADLTGPAVFVLGSEGKGMSKPVTQECDRVLSIGMYGQVNSFNVSCAAAVVLCCAAKSRHKKN